MKKTLLILLVISCQVFAKYSNESEVSSVKTGGNSEVATYLVKTDNKWAFSTSNFGVNGHYTYGEASDQVSARDWHIGPKYDHVIDSRLSYYVGELVEGYTFQGIKARYNSDAGLKYAWIKSDETNLFTEFGYRYSIEDRYETPTLYESKLRLYNEVNQKVNANFSWKYWIEYVPNLTDTKDYLVTHEASLTSILTNMFSLKFAHRGIYDDKPAIEGNKNYDYTWTTSLVARF